MNFNKLLLIEKTVEKQIYKFVIPIYVNNFFLAIEEETHTIKGQNCE